MEREKLLQAKYGALQAELTELEARLATKNLKQMNGNESEAPQDVEM